MVVADEEDVGWGQIFKADAGGAMAARTGKGERADALREDRVGQEIEAFRLDQDGGVTDEGGAQFAALDARDGFGSWSGRDVLAPGTGLTVGNPLYQLLESMLGSAWIEESSILEVIGGRINASHSF